MTQLFRTVLFVCLITFFSVIVFPVAAQITTFTNCGPLGISCGGGANDLEQYIRTIVNGLLGLIGIVAAIYIVYAGIKYITSEGDEKKAEEAKHTILYAVIGLIIIGLSAVIINFALLAIPRGGGAGGGNANNPGPQNPTP